MTTHERKRVVTLHTTLFYLLLLRLVAWTWKRYGIYSYKKWVRLEKLSEKARKRLVSHKVSWSAIKANEKKLSLILSVWIIALET